MKTIIVIENGDNSQTEFNVAAKRLKELIKENPDEVGEIQLSTNGTNKSPSVVLMTAYTDIDEEGNSSAGDCPHFWYDKQTLDKLNIKYLGK